MEKHEVKNESRKHNIHGDHRVDCSEQDQKLFLFDLMVNGIPYNLAS